MLIDLHACPGDLDPDTFAAACRDAGLDAVVVADRLRTDRLDDLLDALDDAGVIGFVGVQIPLDRGAVVLIPSDDDDRFRAMRFAPPWTAESLATRLADFDGVVLAAHPYNRERDGGPVMGDRLYFLKLKQLAAVETRLGRGEPGWDRLAEQAADKRGLARVGSSSGDVKFLGHAVTVVVGEVETQGDLCDALRAGRTLPIELEDPANPRKRPAPERRRDDDDDRGPRRDDDRPRRGRDDRGERGDRGPRRSRDDRGPRRDDDRGPRRDGGDRGGRRDERGGRRDDRGGRRDDGSRGPGRGGRDR
ncbi:MAG: PHP-associated domain-containing protein [bacterium]